MTAVTKRATIAVERAPCGAKHPELEFGKGDERKRTGRVVVAEGCMGGRPTLAGTRLEPAAIYSFWLSGLTAAEIVVQAYPWITEADALAAIAFEQGRAFERRTKRAARRAG